jgi:hypothetical protein
VAGARFLRRRGIEGSGSKTTRYFEEQVLRKRPYILREWCEAALTAPVRREVQADGRIRFWARVVVSGEVRPRFLRGGNTGRRSDGP